MLNRVRVLVVSGLVVSIGLTLSGVALAAAPTAPASAQSAVSGSRFELLGMSWETLSWLLVGLVVLVLGSVVASRSPHRGSAGFNAEVGRSRQDLTPVAAEESWTPRSTRPARAV